MQFTTLVTTAALVTSALALPSMESRASKEVIGPFAIKITAPGKTYNNMYLAGSHIGKLRTIIGMS